VLCGEADGHTAFANGRGHHLGRAGPNIAHCEDAGPAGFNEEWAATESVP
jgi:hypothetical protein